MANLEKPAFVWYKPTTWCLFIHRTAWEPIEMTIDGDRDVWHCNYCSKYFRWPTRKTDDPIYRK